MFIRAVTSLVVPRIADDWYDGGQVALHPDSAIYVVGVPSSTVDYIAETLRRSTGWQFPVRTELPPRSHGTTHLHFQLVEGKAMGIDGYHLRTAGSTIYVEASTPQGLFYGGITLLQLLPPAVFDHTPRTRVSWHVPAGYYTDHARFRWRGAMLDVSRHFFSVEAIKRFIDQLALLKLNVFHWHLTDDQGWRIEIKKYPRLTEVGAWRKETQGNGVSHGGFYTQDEIRDIVAYAAKRHITIVPEIDMPGHMQAAIASYPELGCTEKPVEVATTWGIWSNAEHSTVLYPGPETVQFMQDVLAEVLELFPSPYIHVGGDEAEKTLWKSSRKVQEWMRQLDLKDEEEMQSWFIGQMNDFLTKRGRKLIGWDEILQGGLARGATVMAWRGFSGAQKAVKLGHDTIISNMDGTYLIQMGSSDYGKEPNAGVARLSLEDVYAYSPIPEGVLAEAEQAHILGLQAHLWTEGMPTEYRMHFNAFPRLCALAETAWTDPALKDYGDFLRRLKPHLNRLSIMDVAYRPLDY
jgi:hexosaminidase